MIKNESLLDDLKKEFSEEIEQKTVSIETLLKAKVPTSVLQAEAKLRKVFGDEIYVPEKKEEIVDGEKTVVKLVGDDISFDSQVRDICDNLNNAEFDSKLAFLLLESQDKE